MQNNFEWIFFLPQDKRECNNLFWSLIGIDSVKREIHYHKLHTVVPEDEVAHLTEITQLLHSVDSMSSVSTAKHRGLLYHVYFLTASTLAWASGYAC